MVPIYWSPHFRQLRQYTEFSVPYCLLSIIGRNEKLQFCLTFSCVPNSTLYINIQNFYWKPDLILDREYLWEENMWNLTFNTCYRQFSASLLQQSGECRWCFQSTPSFPPRHVRNIFWPTAGGAAEWATNEKRGRRVWRSLCGGDYWLRAGRSDWSRQSRIAVRTPNTPNPPACLPANPSISCVT